MNKDRVRGKLEDAKGRIKRQAGEWSGNKKLQALGAAKQVKGKMQDFWGKAKEAGHANDPSKANRKKHDTAA